MINCIIIGSHAMQRYFKDFNRKPKDLDIATRLKTQHIKNTDIELLHNPVLLDIVEEEKIDSIYLPPEIMVSLKMSHLFWDINWDKHMWDFQYLLKRGYLPNQAHVDRLYAFFCSVNGDIKRSNLDMSAEEFFDNALKTYDHDALHHLLTPNPAYKELLIGEVLPSEEKFEQLAFEKKLAVVREEVYVMAFERLAGRRYQSAYDWMLKKFIREHAPMWLAKFAIMNYLHLYRPQFNYAQHLSEKLA